MVKNISTANLYQLQDGFNEAMDILKDKFDCDDECMAELCLTWVRGLIK